MKNKRVAIVLSLPGAGLILMVCLISWRLMSFVTIIPASDDSGPILVVGSDISRHTP